MKAPLIIIDYRYVQILLSMLHDMTCYTLQLLSDHLEDLSFFGFGGTYDENKWYDATHTQGI